MTMWRDPAFELLQKLAFLRALGAGGLRPWHRLLLVSGDLNETRRGPPGWRYISSEAEPAEILAALEAHRPHMLYGFLTPLRQLAEQLQRLGRTQPLRSVFSTAEPLDPSARALLAATFQAELFDIYGCTEAGPLAWECRMHQGLHVAADMALLECEGRPGMPASLVVTSLELLAMPLIRYEVGDLALPMPAGRCDCGCTLPRLQRVEGRVVDRVRLPDGSMLSPFG